MHTLVVTVGIGILMFASTNVDDLFLMIAFYADHSYRGRYIVIGQFAGIGLLTGATVAISLVALTIPSADLGLLGLMPLLLGGRRLYRAKFIKPTMNLTPVPQPILRAGSKTLAVMATTLATGGDNLGVGIPVFATRSTEEIWVLIVTTLLMTGGWLTLAWFLVRHPAAGKPVRKYGEQILPWILIIIGCYVLSESKLLHNFRL